VIAANLPQFPVQHALNDGRLPSWSSGGPDGRAVVDPFLHGLAQHLAPGGLVVMTHNSFISLEHTQALLAESGLHALVASTVSVALPRHKLQGLPAQVLQAYLGHGLHLLGDGAFADFHVLDICHAPTAQG
jgi:release factor glutamine methyltransferase